MLVLQDYCRNRCVLIYGKYLALQGSSWLLSHVDTILTSFPVNCRLHVVCLPDPISGLKTHSLQVTCRPGKALG